LIASLDKQVLALYLRNQLNSFFPDQNIVEVENILRYMDDAIFRVGNCFKHIQKPYYNYAGSLTFNHLHSDHYAAFLYLFANTVWKIDRNEVLAAKVFLLNKALNGIDAFYGIDLPEVFLFIHPVGTVLGRAKYSNYFAVYQNCSVGASEDLIYPTFNGETIMYSKSSVIGNCNIGSNTIFAANSFLINNDVKNSKIILGSFPDNRIIQNDKNVIDRIFK
jgi:serine O-acetyltransferase